MFNTDKRPESPTGARMGAIGQAVPIADIARAKWDAIVVGAGHNGLTCAAYLAKAGKRVVVLEARDRVGGACTLEETWPGCYVSPCAYLAGLLHPRVIQDLELVRRGFAWTPAVGGFFVPFDDGSSLQLWSDNARCEAEVREFAPGDVAGWRAMGALKNRVREALRPATDRDLWLGEAPTRAEVMERLGHDPEAIGLVFEWSMAEYVARYLQDERMRMAYLGQGVIGTKASPFDKGTASIAFHHGSGRMDGMAGTWGYVKGGMGMVSFLLCDAAQDYGAQVLCGAPVARIIPGEGVELTGGERVFAPVVVANADPHTTSKLIGTSADQAWCARVRRQPVEGCTMKVNLVLNELPNFRARPGTNEALHLGQVNTPLTEHEWKDGFAAVCRGELPKRLWTELYFQTAYDPSVAPKGKHMMSVFAQYVPHTFAQGDWDSHREEVGRLAIAAIARFTSNLPDAIVHQEVLGPPDIERKVGLAGGHIFQGDMLPENMWSERLSARTPMPGVYLCGAGTYPGGSVIAVNGRNAAMAVLTDTGKKTP